MSARGIFVFLLQAVTAGLALAFVLLWLQPDLVSRSAEPPSAVAPAGSTPPVPIPPLQPVDSYASAVEAAAPAVVNIYTTKLVQRSNALENDPILRRFFGDRFGVPDQRLETSLGSGVIVSVDGFILTNHHVIRGADAIEVLLRDGRSAPARIVGADPETDLAVLKIELDPVPIITIGQADRVRIGDIVLAIGNPYGVGQTVTQGIVSATGRNRLGITTFENFIQTDAAINPGNSGGALVNTAGQLVGINTAIVSGSGGAQGIGFAIPASLATAVLDQIVNHGRVVRGWLGIEGRDLTAEQARYLQVPGPGGVLVQGVLQGGPADLAGIEPGDVITRIEGEPVSDSRTAIDIISAVPPGRSIEIYYLRDGLAAVTHAVVSQRPSPSVN